MIFFLVLSSISIGALALLFSRGFLRLKTLSKDEILSHCNSAKPFWSDFHNLFVRPVVRVHQENVRPAAYKEIEKMARRFRIIALRVECLLMRFTEYIRGKRTMAANGHKPACASRSHYWEQINNCKNGINGKGENKPA